MRFEFEENQKINGLHLVEIPEDELVLEGEYVEKADDVYVITGIATIEGERYHDFQIEFQLCEVPAEETLEAIMSVDWEWYDYIC